MGKSEHSDAIAYIAGLNKKVRNIAIDAHQILIDEGCSSYVKTIYIGSEMTTGDSLERSNDSIIESIKEELEN